MSLRLLFIGDVVGRTGRAAIARHLPDLRARYKLDFVVVNGENAAGGFGITEAICDEFLAAGADCVTLGNHAWDQKEAWSSSIASPVLSARRIFLRARPAVARACMRRRRGARVLVMNLMGAST